MIADLHAHYPMRVINDMDPETTARLMKTPGPTIRDRIQALVLKIANRLGNQLNDGIRKKHDYTETLDESLRVIYTHIDENAERMMFKNALGVLQTLWR